MQIKETEGFVEWVDSFEREYAIFLKMRLFGSTQSRASYRTLCMMVEFCISRRVLEGNILIKSKNEPRPYCMLR